MERWARWLVLGFASCLVALGAIACNGGTDGELGDRPLRVGSKDFTEQFVLGEIYAQTLEAAGIRVERKLNLGGTPVAQAGLLAGEIDLYPEYTGTGLLTVLKLPPDTDRERVYQTVAAAYRDRFDVIWLAPSPMSNSQALVTTPAVADRLRLQTISDLVGRAPELRAVGPPEFQVREDGLPGLQTAYGAFDFKTYKAVDPGLRYPALVAGEADVAVGFSTDGEIGAFDLVVLGDDRQFFPPYQVAPVVRSEAIERHPELVELLDGITAQIDDATMQALNFEVTGDKREPADVARDWLAGQALLPPPAASSRT